jgi:hypothetical protein
VCYLYVEPCRVRQTQIADVVVNRPPRPYTERERDCVGFAEMAYRFASTRRHPPMAPIRFASLFHQVGTLHTLIRISCSASIRCYKTTPDNNDKLPTTNTGHNLATLLARRLETPADGERPAFGGVPATSRVLEGLCAGWRITLFLCHSLLEYILLTLLSLSRSVSSGVCLFPF